MVGDLVIDAAAREVRLAGRPVELTLPDRTQRRRARWAPRRQHHRPRQAVL